MENRLKIAMLGHKRIPSREGGVEIVVEELAARMAVAGHRVTCYNRGGHHVSGRDFDTGKLKAYKGIRLKTVPTIDKKGLAALTSSAFAALCAAFGDYDIVHFHAEGPCAMLWLPRLLGKRCVATIHGLDWQREKWKQGFGARYIKFGEKVAAKYADEIIVLSRNVQAYFWNTYGRKTCFIPNGVSPAKRQEAREITRNYGLHRGDYILFLGRIVPEKGLRYLISAFQDVKTDKKLVIAGGASDSDGFVKEIKKMAEPDQRILFTGFVSGRILEELYSNAYLYVLPSDLEGMPLSLLEAMCYGNCCLVSNIPECTEVVENKAAVFQKGCKEDLREKLQMLCDDPAQAGSYQQTAAEFICRKYDWNVVAEETLRLYQDMQESVV